METETDRLQERGRGRLSYSCLSLTHKVSASSDLSPAFLFWQEKKMWVLFIFLLTYKL